MAVWTTDVRTLTVHAASCSDSHVRGAKRASADEQAEPWAGFQPGVLLLGKKSLDAAVPTRPAVLCRPIPLCPRLVAARLQCVSAERWTGSM